MQKVYNKWIHLKCTEKEHVICHQIARNKGLTVSNLLRDLLGLKKENIDPKPQRKSRRADPAVILSLARIGNNLNQLARWANTHKAKADHVQVLIMLTALERDIVEFSNDH